MNAANGTVPFDEKSERLVIGAIIGKADLGEDPFETCPQLWFSPGRFFDDRHRAFYKAALDARDDFALPSAAEIYKRLDDGAKAHREYLFELSCPPPDGAVKGALVKLAEAEAQRALLEAGGNPDKARIALAELDRAMTGREDGLPPIEDAATMAENEPEPAEIIKGLAHKGSKLALGGGSKSMKTWTLADLALSVANGAKWLDFETTEGRVLYLNFEIQKKFFRKRLDAVSQAKGLTIHNLDVWNLRGYATDAAVILPKVEKRIQQVGYSIIIADPIYKLYGERLDENKAGDVARLLNQLERLAVNSGALVAFSAHYSKGNQAGKDSIDRVSGSGVFARDPDSLVMLTAHKEPDAFTVECTLRNFKPVEPFTVRWDYPLMRLAPELDPAELKPHGGRPQVHDPLKILAAIRDTSEQDPISTSDWAERARVTRSTLTNFLPMFRQKNQIRTIGEGSKARKYITEEGRRALR